MSGPSRLLGEIHPGPISDASKEALRTLCEADAALRLVRKDPELYGPDPERIRTAEHRMDWVDLADTMAERVEDIRDFARDALKDGLTHAVLLGMGGSSLAPLVFVETFGVGKGGLSLEVLDSSSPDAVRRVAGSLAPEDTLILVSSKSGTTAEPQALKSYFEAFLKARLGEDWPRRMVAITDPGTPLAEEAREEGWRRVFLNPPDIGGRYSALSYFGLVPLALLGHDIDRLLASAREMLEAVRTGIGEKNPALALGALLGGAFAAGRDRLTLVGGGPARSFPLWLEQLVAESTGKDGKGLLPVAMEPERQRYGSDRLFVTIGGGGGVPAGEPWAHFALESPFDLGREMLRFEMGVALSGVVMGLDPFNEPNVAESKANTRRILEGLCPGDALPGHPVRVEEAVGLIRDLLRRLDRGAYLQVAAYVDPGAGHDAQLRLLRKRLSGLTDVPITSGYGPRFLHSTGQYHKGGRPVGSFIQLVSESEPLEIPGAPYGFEVLIRAQAEGDREALARRGFPVVTVDLGADVERGLSMLTQEL